MIDITALFKTSTHISNITFKDYVMINKAYNSYGLAYKIETKYIKIGLIIFALVTPFTNFILIPLAFKINKPVYIRFNKRRK